MGCSCKKTRPAKFLIFLSLIIILLFNNTVYATLAFKVGEIIQATGLAWFTIIYVQQQIRYKKIKKRET